MAWQLCRAVLRCQRRRILGALRAAPLPGACVLVAAVAAPLASWRLGHALGSALRPLLHDPAFASRLALAPAVAGASAGAVVCVTTAGRRSLGPQLAALPVGLRAALFATVLFPACAALALGLPAALALAVPLGAASAGGAIAGIGLVAAAGTGAAAGAVAAESVLHVWSGAPHRGLVSLLSLGAAWTGAGALLGTAELGPLAPIGAALAGGADAFLALTAAVGAAVLGGLAWLELAARRPDRMPVARSSRRCRVSGPLVTALASAATVLLVRRRDLRLAVFAAVGLGLGGVVLALGAGVPAPGPLHLGASTTLLGAALVPLAVGGVLGAGRWTWACAPRGRMLPCVALVGAAHAVLLAALIPILALSAVVSAGAPHALAEIAFVALGLAAAAALAGALVPWRGATMGDQVASFAVFAACAGLLSAAAGVAGPRLVAAGVPDAPAAACVLVAAAAVSLGALMRRVA